MEGGYYHTHNSGVWLLTTHAYTKIKSNLVNIYTQTLTYTRTHITVTIVYLFNLEIPELVKSFPPTWHGFNLSKSYTVQLIQGRTIIDGCIQHQSDTSETPFLQNKQKGPAGRTSTLQSSPGLQSAWIQHGPSSDLSGSEEAPVGPGEPSRASSAPCLE